MPSATAVLASTIASGTSSESGRVPDRRAVAEAPSQELVNRQADRQALQIPQSHLERRLRVE